MNRKIIFWMNFFLALVFLGYICIFRHNKVFQIEYDVQSPDPVSMVSDKQTLYEDVAEKTLYLTIKDSGWEEMNKRDILYYNDKNKSLPELNVLVQFGNNVGPTSDQYGFNDVTENAKIKLYGTNLSKRQQKSYRIDINQGAGNINGMKSFILDKSFTDPFRFSNKLCFDLLTEVDSLMSTRTYFTDVYIKNEEDGDDSSYIYYGLFTMIEPINKRYLLNRGLDTDGELYAIKNFDFKRHEDVIMQSTDFRFDKVAFEEMIESKGNDDHSKLLKILDDMQNMDIEEVTKVYFDEDNLYDWMAFNILVGNQETATTNFYLYSPVGTEKFFIIPWDFDNAFRDGYETDKNNAYISLKGIDLFKDSELFGRIVQNERCRNRLSTHITELHKTVFDKKKLEQRISRMGTDISYRIYSLPDKTFARITREKYKEYLKALPEQIDSNYFSYYQSFEETGEGVADVSE